eukprot:7156-Heterococcus_DN1.PRE.2
MLLRSIVSAGAHGEAQVPLAQAATGSSEDDLDHGPEANLNDKDERFNEIHRAINAYRLH